MIEMQWLDLTQRFTGINLGGCIVMPSHFHGTIEIVGAPLVGAQNSMGAQNPEQPSVHYDLSPPMNNLWQETLAKDR